MDPRTQHILSTVVREYIRRAEPIGSEWLAESFDFGIAPATMRQELARLDDAGYLEQPHTSAGRIPTDKGYRFFVNLLLAAERDDHEEFLQAMVRHAEELDRHRQNIARIAAHWLGRESHSLAFVGLDPLYAFGLKQLLRQPEFSEAEYLTQALTLFESIEERITDLAGCMAGGGPSVFIGRENPLREARRWSMVMGQFERGSEPGVIAIVGPTRMDYDRNIALVEAMRRFLTGNEE